MPGRGSPPIRHPSSVKVIVGSLPAMSALAELPAEQGVEADPAQPCVRRGLDGGPCGGQVSQQYDLLDAPRDRGVDQRSVKELRLGDGHDDPIELASLGLVHGNGISVDNPVEVVLSQENVFT